MERPTVGLAGSAEYDGGMDVSSANRVNERILAEIIQHDGQLGWHEIAIAVGAATVEQRSRVFADLVRLEHSGGVCAKREAGGLDTGSWELPTSRVKFRIRLTRFRSPRHGAQWAFEFVALAPELHSAISQPKLGTI